MIERLGARAIAMIVFGVFVVGLLIFGVSQCQKKQSAGVQSKVDRGQSGALANSAADAIGTTQDVGANAVTSEDLTRQNEKDIRHAEGANDAVNPAVRDAGLASLCRRPAYRNSEQCRLLKPPAR